MPSTEPAGLPREQGLLHQGKNVGNLNGRELDPVRTAGLPPPVQLLLVRARRGGGRHRLDLRQFRLNLVPLGEKLCQIQ
ncbi:hypothetical protein [Streptomyces sp. NPDC059468]|uniref:hypothetical protein n=1 Tax=Streptomyces sp. NPDC059468 TaxID=3346845 RepID=UPI0036955251